MRKPSSQTAYLAPPAKSVSQRGKIDISSCGSAHQANQLLSISAEKRALRFITRISRTFRRFWLTWPRKLLKKGKQDYYRRGHCVLLRAFRGRFAVFGLPDHESFWRKVNKIIIRSKLNFLWYGMVWEKNWDWELAGCFLTISARSLWFD